MHWFNDLPARLRLSAYRSGVEAAWSRADALEVIAMLKQRGFYILGVDIWLPTIPGPTIPTPFIYDWNEAHVGDYPNIAPTASEFVSSFAWDPTDANRHECPYFCITVSKDDV